MRTAVVSIKMAGKDDYRGKLEAGTMCDLVREI